MKHLTLTLGILAFASALPSHAANVTTHLAVTSVYAKADGSFVIGVDELPAVCTIGGLTVTVGQNSVTADGFKLIFAAALAAQTTGSRIFVAYDDASSSCYVNRLRIQN